ncbi:hypothetical protein LR010_01510 [Candidatus Gracilibacteria bacterium]|nr:hypothetical protein [Candidatus Gracilibacteria bacterium]
MLDVLADTQYKNCKIFSVTDRGHHKIIGQGNKSGKKTPPTTSKTEGLIPEYTS